MNVNNSILNLPVLFNNNTNNINININYPIGYIQEKLLSLFNLIIYNIEYSLIIIDDNEYILGIDDLDFHNNLINFLSNNNLDSIKSLKIIPRKRDENGNVIKNNLIIDKFNIWFQNKQSLEYRKL